MEAIGIIVSLAYVLIAIIAGLLIDKTQDIPVDGKDDGIVWLFAAMWPLFLFLYLCVKVCDWFTNKIFKD